MNRIRIVEPGHVYLIQNLDGDGEQQIGFVQRPPYHEPAAGILIQDLLRISIDRVKVLETEVSAEENIKVLYHLRQALLWQELRALRRKVDLGKLLAIENLDLGEDGHFKLVGEFYAHRD